MRISTKGQYALSAVLLLATQSPKSLSIRAISEETGISHKYLEQIFILLRKSGIVKSVQGAQGGYALVNDAAKTYVGQVLRATEGSLTPVHCLEENDCPRQKNCVTRGLWQEVYDVINASVDCITMQELAKSYHAMDELNSTWYYAI